MNFFTVIAMLGGLALFLFGMYEMSNGLEKLSGGTLEKTLKKFTSNIFKGVLLGLIVTAIIQSSSATTVIVVGLVNAGLLSLRQAIGVIMGANIGTTITGQITRLIDLNGVADQNPILHFFNPTNLAPFVAIFGIILIMACKGKKQKIIGQIIMGFSVLFTGMISMSDSVKPLAQSEVFMNVLQQFSHIPILGLFTGMIVTAIIQSSSASVGMLQAISATGSLTFSATYPIILGQNIGTCITSVLSSIGTSKNARRTAAVHVYFNILGSVLFMILLTVLKYCDVFSGLWFRIVDSGMIANFHTVFNIVTTLLLLPFARVLEKLAILTIPDNKNRDEDDDVEIGILDDRFLLTPALAIKQCATTVEAMGKLSIKNYHSSIKLLKEFSEKKSNKVKIREDKIDNMEDALAHYIVKINDYDMTDQDSRKLTYILRIMPEFERIGDHSVNIMELATKLHEIKGINLSSNIKKEIQHISEAVEEILNLCYSCVINQSAESLISVESLEDIIDRLKEALERNNTERLKSGKCDVEISMIFIDLLINFERIADHCSNIALETYEIYSEHGRLNHHEFIREIHKGGDEVYNKHYNKYKDKYLDPVKK